MMESLLPHHDGYPVSRDWQDIECKAMSCVYNFSGICTVPSLCEISEEGRCKGFKANTTQERKDA
ncbi:MAG: hypothetical protein WC919_01510 [Candidatus Paceibacterota bacterium]|jgi:hypothetical protein